MARGLLLIALFCLIVYHIFYTEKIMGAYCVQLIKRGAEFGVTKKAACVLFFYKWRGVSFENGCAVKGRCF